MSLPHDSAERKKYPIFAGVLAYFPDAIAEVARVSYDGNEKHNPGEPLHWSREKSSDHEDCIQRHTLDALSADNPDDVVTHLANRAWRALAALQLAVEAREELENSWYIVSVKSYPQTDDENYNPYEDPNSELYDPLPAGASCGEDDCLICGQVDLEITDGPGTLGGV